MPNRSFFTTKAAVWQERTREDQTVPWTDGGKKGFEVEFENPKDVFLHLRYEGLINSGASGAVNKMTCTGNNRLVAVKTMNASSIKHELWDEVNIILPLKHYHVIRVTGSYTCQDTLGIILEPVASCSLDEVLAKTPSHAVKDLYTEIPTGFPTGSRSVLLRRSFGCIASALCYVHENLVRHKDIKPSNILLKGLRIILSDFGISKKFSETASGSTGQSRKTLMYTAPEFMRDPQHKNKSADVFSLGCVFAEMFAVYKGKTVEDFLEHRKKKDPGDIKEGFFFRTIPAAIQWVEKLAESSCDLQFLRLLRLMLKENYELRATAEDVWKTLATLSDEEPIRHFCGPCCMPLLKKDPMLQYPEENPVETSYEIRLPQTSSVLPSDTTFKVEFTSSSQQPPLEWIRNLRVGKMAIVDVVRTSDSNSVTRKITQSSEEADNEADMVSKLNHRHIQRLSSTYKLADDFVLLFQPAARYDLRTSLEYYTYIRPPCPRFLRQGFGCLANALAFVHESGISHCDIKPENILIYEERLFLAKFALARKSDSNTPEPLRSSAMTMGNDEKNQLYPYRAPEWQPDYRFDLRKADVFSLGCVFMEIYTVVQGKSVREFEEFRQADNHSSGYCATLPKALEWLLKIDDGTYETKDKFINTLQNMVAEDPRRRLSSTEVLGGMRNCYGSNKEPRCGTGCCSVS